MVSGRGMQHVTFHAVEPPALAIAARDGLDPQRRLVPGRFVVGPGQADFTAGHAGQQPRLH
ncbi:hypothetical protein ACEN8K_20925, partial [Variovorax sp. CT11-76]